MQTAANDRALRFPEVRTRTGLSRTSIWRLTRAGNFPQPIRLTGSATGAVAWLESDISQWLESRLRAGGR